MVRAVQEPGGTGVGVGVVVQVPQEYVKNGEIVLNVSYDATSGLTLGNDVIEFKARFAGTPREIIVPIDRVLAIYARENGQGMAFPMRASNNGADVGITAVAPPPEARTPLTAVSTSKTNTPTSDDDDAPPTSPSGRPSLKRVK